MPPARMMDNRLASYIAVLLLLASAHPATGKGLEELEWIEVNTPNFRIRSVFDEKKTIRLARQLEMFRVAVSIVTNVSRTESPIPTEIHALQSERDFRRIGIGPGVGGVFSQSLRKNLIIIRGPSLGELSHVIFHEYVHFLARNHGSAIYPRWFDEGFAEFLGAARIRDGKLEFGYAPEGRQWLLSNYNRGRWIPMREVLSPGEFENSSGWRTALFYAEAWALIHFLHNRPASAKSFGQDMARYIELVETGKGHVEAFEDAFDIGAEDLDKQLKRYVKKRRFLGFRLDIDEINDNYLSDLNLQVRYLSREQVSLGLGQVALWRGMLEEAKDWFTIAAEDERLKPRAEAGLGNVLRSKKNLDAAQPHFELAVSLAPDDAFCQTDAAEYWHDRARKTTDAIERMVYLERAREHFLNAWKLDKSKPETYALWGNTFLTEGKKFNLALQMLKHAEGILPSNLDLRVMLARAYVATDRKDDAVAKARSIVAWSHDQSGAAEAARQILSDLTPEGN